MCLWTGRYAPKSGTPGMITLPTLVSGKTALILGCGHIGKVLAKLIAGFTMTLMATRNRIESPVIEDSVQIYPSNNLNDLLPKADFLIVTLPLTLLTKGLIGKKELALLPDHAVVVNISRVDIIDLAARGNPMPNLVDPVKGY